MSHPKLWLQFLPLPEPALSPQAGRFPFPNLSPSEGWVLMAAVEGRSLVPVPRHGGGRAGGARPGEGCQPHPRQTCVLGAQPAQAAVRWRRALLLGRVTA